MAGYLNTPDLIASGNKSTRLTRAVGFAIAPAAGTANADTPILSSGEGGASTDKVWSKSPTGSLRLGIYSSANTTVRPEYKYNETWYKLVVAGLPVADSVKILVGTGSDVEIYHDGTNSYAVNNTGNLIIDNKATTGKTYVDLGTDTSATAFAVRNNSGTELFKVSADGVAAVTSRLTTTDGVSSGTARVVGGRAYSATAASAAITGATETSTVFDTSYTMPANTMKAGTVIRFTAWGKHTAVTGSETHTLAYKVGSVALFTSTDLDPNANDYFRIEGELVIRTAGASGTCVGWAKLTYGASAAAGTVLSYYLDSTTIDTTAAAICGVYIDRQATATDSDSARLDHHYVEVV